MAHNTSRTKRERIQRDRAAAELAQWLVPGWQVDRNALRLIPVDTVLGHWQRKQEVVLRCRKRDCHRRVVVDLDSAIEEGLADKPLKELIGTLRCGHWCGCELQEMHAIYPDGVPLVSYINEDRVLIAVECAACEARLTLPPRQMITRLERAGRGDGSVGLLKLGDLVRGPCRKCGGSRFRSEVVMPKALGT